MALSNIQDLMLNLVISHETLHELYREPDKYQKQFDLTDEEISAALQMPRRTIGSFQMMVVSKRINRTRASHYVGRTLGYMSRQQKGDAMRSFISKYVMKKNEWMERVPDFLDHVEAFTFGENSDANEINRAILAFERWVYQFSTAESQLVPKGTGYVLSPDVQVEAFPFPAEPLITMETTESNFALLKSTYGKKGYILAQRTQNRGFKDVDLYEIDLCYYRLLVEATTPQSKEEFCLQAAAVANELGVERAAEEMFNELLELGILVYTEEVM